jgi:hypothetical protein
LILLAMRLCCRSNGKFHVDQNTRARCIVHPRPVWRRTRAGNCSLWYVRNWDGDQQHRKVNHRPAKELETPGGVNAGGGTGSNPMMAPGANGMSTGASAPGAGSSGTTAPSTGGTGAC